MRLQTVALCLLAFGVAACSQQRTSPAETQAGSAADQQQGPREGSAAGAGCRDLPSADQLRAWLRQAPGEVGESGGLFSGKMSWASIVDRNGVICTTVVATDDPASAWPGSQAIAKAKAYTANAY